MERETAVSGEYRAAVRGAALLTVAGLISGLGNLLFNVIVARAGGVAAYSGVGALLAIATVAGFVSTGVQYAVARRTAIRQMDAWTNLLLGLGSLTPWLLASVALVGTAPLLSVFLHLSGPAPALLTLVLVPIMLLTAVVTGVLLGLQRFHVIAVVSVVFVALRVGLGAVLVHVFDPTTGALLASVLPQAAVVAVMAIVVAFNPRSRSTHSWTEARAGYERGANVEGAIGGSLSAALWACWSLPVVFARHSLSGTDAGSFAALQLLAGGILFLTAPLVSALHPTIARHARRRTIITGLGLTLALCAVAVAGLVALGPTVLGVVYGDAFRVSRALALGLGVSVSAVAVATYVLWVWRAVRRRFSRVGAAILVALVLDCIACALWSDGSVVALAWTPALAVFAGAAAVGLTALLRRPATPREGAPGIAATDPRP